MGLFAAELSLTREQLLGSDAGGFFCSRWNGFGGLRGGRSLQWHVLSKFFLIDFGVKYSPSCSCGSGPPGSGVESIFQAGLNVALDVNATVDDRDMEPSFIKQLLHLSRVT